MKQNILMIIAVLVAAAIGILALKWWFSAAPLIIVTERAATPQEKSMTNNLQTSVGATVNIEGSFRKFDGVPGSLPGSWPRFRGSNLDNICADNVSLAENWPEKGPPVLWSVALGEGYAGPAVLNGRVYLLDYDGKEEADALRCFSLDDGKEIWRRWYKIQVKRNHGMSRTVPAVTDKYVVTIGPRCHVMCVDADTGNFRWGLDLVRDFGAKEPMWYTGQCPLIENNTAVIAVGGKSLMMGVDCQTGKIVWETPNPRAWQMSHASIVPMTLAGKLMYVYCAIGGIAGIEADRENHGGILWESPEWNHEVVAPSPVPLDDGRIFVTAGYGVGSAMFQIRAENGKFSAKLLHKLDRKEFACEQQTPIYYDGFLFSILPADAGSLKKQAVCMKPDGNVVWRSGHTEQFGLGPFMIADGKVLILNDDGTLTMIKATGEGYVKLARAKVMDGREAWAPMALVNGRLLLRDYTKMICLDVAKQ